MSNRQEIQIPATEGLFEQLGCVEAVRVGNSIHVSGQVGWDENLKPGAGMEAQARLAFQGLKNVLKKAGAEPRHITHLQLFFVFPDGGPSLMEHATTVFNVKKEVMPECRPAATGVRVQQLVHPDLMLEVQATAVID